MPKRTFADAFGPGADNVGDRITKSGKYSISEKVAASGLTTLARQSSPISVGDGKVSDAQRPGWVPAPLTERALAQHNRETDAGRRLELRSRTREGR